MYCSIKWALLAKDGGFRASVDLKSDPPDPPSLDRFHDPVKYRPARLDTPRRHPTLTNTYFTGELLRSIK